MQEDFFKDPVFVERLKQDEKRIEALAKDEGKTKREVIDSERQQILNDMDILLGNAMNDIKERNVREKYELQSYVGERIVISNRFKNNLGFVA